MILGELLLPPKRLRQLTWDELDHLLIGQDIRRQKDMVGFRLVATQTHNGDFVEKLTPHDYLPLPAVDGASGAHQGKQVNAEWHARMKEKHGDKLEG